MNLFRTANTELDGVDCYITEPLTKKERKQLLSFLVRVLGFLLMLALYILTSPASINYFWGI